MTPGTQVSDGWIPTCESSHRDIIDPYSPYPDLGFRAKYFTFSLAQDADIRIDITSEENTYLYLLDGHGEFAIPLLEFDNEPVLTTLPAGDYTIELTTNQRYSPGNFSLLLDILNNSANCNQALRFNQTINDAWSNNCLIQSWDLTNQDPYAGINPERAMYYTFTLNDPTDFRFRIFSSDAAMVLNLYDGNDFTLPTHSTNPSNFSFGSLGKTIETGLVPGTYTLEVTSYNQIALGDFSFEAKILGISACSQTINIGNQYTGLISEGCFSQFRQGTNSDPYGPQLGEYYAKRFELTLTQPSAIDISTNLTDTPAYLYLAHKNDTGLLTLIQESTHDYWDTSRSQQLSRVLDAGTYIVEVTTEQPIQTSAYTFSVRIGSSSACEIFTPLNQNLFSSTNGNNCPSAFKESYQNPDPYGTPPRFIFNAKTGTFKVETAGEYRFNLSTFGFIPHFFLVTGINRQGQILLDERFTNNAETIIQPLEPGFYTFEITSAEASQSGSLTLSITDDAIPPPNANAITRSIRH